MNHVICPACYVSLGMAMPWEDAEERVQQHLQTCSTARTRQQFDKITAGLRL